MSTATIQAAIGGSPAEIVYDGQFHRFQVEGSKRNAGWYVAKLRNGLPIISFGNWQDGSKYSIFGGELVDGDQPTSTYHRPDRQDLEDWKAAQAREQANSIWKNSTRPCDQHAYLNKKQVQPHGARILVESQVSNSFLRSWIDKHSLHGALIIPMMIGDRIVDLQFITQDEKFFLPGGDHKGARYTLGNPAESSKLIVATGFATSATLYECTGYPVIFAFNDGNLDKAVNAIRNLYPKHEIIIAADNDIHTDKRKVNSGVVYSTAVAKKHNLALAIPELHGKKVDYNDLFLAEGKQSVIDSVNSAIQINPAIEISASKASELLSLAIDDWLDSKDHCAIKAPAGLGKSTLLIQAIRNRNLSCDYFVPSYKLAQEQVVRLPAGAAIAIRGRTHATENDAPLCVKHEAAQGLIDAGLANKTMPLLCGKIDPTTGKRPCPYSENCGYLKQFNSSAPIRFYAHEYLPLENSRLTKRDIDVAVIDESFYDSLEKLPRWSIGYLMTQPESVYRELVMAIIENRLLSMNHLLDSIDAIIATEAEIESHIHPEMDHRTAANKTKPLAELRKKPIAFLWNCKQAIESNSENRLFVGKHDHSMIFASYVKPIQFINKDTPTAYLDASLMKGIIKTINPDCRIVEIEATRKAHITQITDSTISTTRLMSDNDYLSSRLIHFIQVQAKANPNGAVIAPMKWIEAHKDRFPASVKLAHFGALRGLNTLEGCDWLVQIGRNQPPPYAVEAIARAWYPKAKLNFTGAFLKQERSLAAKTGDGALVWTDTHVDGRVREILEAIREQESLQALDRLRLIHGSVKRIWLFSNLPLPGIEADELATLDSLTLPGRLAEVALRDSVVMTGRSELNQRYPDVFPTKKAAERYINEFNLNAPFSKYIYLLKKRGIYELKPHESMGQTLEIDLLGNRPIYRTINYRIEGQPGKPRTVIVPYGFDTDLLDRLTALHGGKVIKLVEPEPSDSPAPAPAPSATAQPEPEPTVEPSATVEPAPAPSPAPSLESVLEPEPEPAPAPIVDWTKIKLACVWKWDGRMITKCNKPDIYDHPNGKVAGCRNCGAIHQEHAAMTL